MDKGKDVYMAFKHTLLFILPVMCFLEKPAQHSDSFQNCVIKHFSNFW